MIVSLTADCNAEFTAQHQAIPRTLEIAQHRSFSGTAFEPGRSGLAETTYPLIPAFLGAIA